MNSLRQFPCQLRLDKHVQYHVIRRTNFAAVGENVVGLNTPAHDIPQEKREVFAFDRHWGGSWWGGGYYSPPGMGVAFTLILLACRLVKLVSQFLNGWSLFSIVRLERNLAPFLT